MLKVLVIKSSDKDTFSCNVCGDSFTGKINYTQHMSTHSRDELFSLTYIMETPLDKEPFQGPITKYRGEGQKTCSVCFKVLKSFSNLVEHMRSHTGEKPFACSICGKKFSRKSHVRDHEARHYKNDGPPFTCTYCHKIFARKGNLTCHLKYVHKIEMEQLEKESKIVQKHLEEKAGREAEKQSVGEERHITWHVGKQTERQVEGEMKKDETTKDKKEAEIETQVENVGPVKLYEAERKFSCGVGSEIFRLKDQTGVQTQDNEQAGEPAERKFICGICDITYFRKHQLVDHIRIHSEEILCRICDKTFRSQEMLANHKELHTQRKHHDDSVGSSAPRYNGSFTCTVCDKEFAFKGTLTFHMRVHGDEGVYSCNVCEKYFQHRRSLRKHLKHRKYMDIVNKTCKVCSKKYPSNSALNSHMRIHTSRKTFQCCFCHKELKKSRKLFDGKGFDGRLCRVCIQVCLSCVLCNKVVRISSLRQHLGHHLGEF